ncbi:MAG: M23 family metallopeptidase [Alistipes sp.]|nr:M23 family metallopeptidase [Alistipes sp.]
MKFFRNISSWFRELLRKRRLSISNVANNEEEWYVHISPAALFSAFVAMIIVLFIILLTLVAYTPVLEFLPGYRTEATRSREMLIENTMRMDSIERVINRMLTYNESVIMVLEGRSPVIPSRAENDSLNLDKSLILPNAADSALRAQMEGDGVYSLGQGSSRRSVREAVEMVTPVNGIITKPFDIKSQQYGVKIAAAAESEVAAIEGGTVILSIWSPDSGYTIQIQHSSNLLSIYKHLVSSSVAKGQIVKRGELIGTTGDSSRDEQKQFEFELWSDGKAVDPESYIIF